MNRPLLSEAHNLRSCNTETSVMLSRGQFSESTNHMCVIATLEMEMNALEFQEENFLVIKRFLWAVLTAVLASNPTYPEPVEQDWSRHVAWKGGEEIGRSEHPPIKESSDVLCELMLKLITNVWRVSCQLLGQKSLSELFHSLSLSKISHTF